MKVTIVAGGTGGHFYPGLAAAQEFGRRDVDVRFIVRTDDFVIPLLERENIPFDGIAGLGFRRSLDPRNALVALKIAQALFQSFRLFVRSRPDALLVMGGYLSFAPALAAALLGIPVYLHEQNARPGLANTVIGPLCRGIAVSFPETRKKISGKVEVTGLPVRDDVIRLPDKRSAVAQFGLDPSRKTILVFGGSLGACRLNQIVREAFVADERVRKAFQLIHLTGKADESATRKIYGGSGVAAFVAGYWHDMPSAYAAADLLVCRAGASTVAEIMAVRRPALLIPYPYATGNHQKFNAGVLVSLGVARVYEEKEMSSETLTSVLREFLETPTLLDDLRRGFRSMSFGPEKAAGRLADLVLRR